MSHAGSDVFSVNENNSLVLQAALDRESTSSYDITVTVNNIGTCYLAGITYSIVMWFVFNETLPIQLVAVNAPVHLQWSSW